MLTPESFPSTLPKARSPSLFGSPRANQSSLRSMSPVPSTSSPRPTSLALPETDPAPLMPDQAKPSGETAVNTDVLLPIIIYAVVKTNPVQLVSQLLFIQRYRSRQVGGEESFCLINFLAVVEFLGTIYLVNVVEIATHYSTFVEHVDMQALGLGDADRVMRYGTAFQALHPTLLTPNHPALRTSHLCPFHHQ